MRDEWDSLPWVPHLRGTPNCHCDLHKGLQHYSGLAQPPIRHDGGAAEPNLSVTMTCCAGSQYPECGARPTPMRHRLLLWGECRAGSLSKYPSLRGNFFWKDGGCLIFRFLSRAPKNLCSALIVHLDGF